MIRRRIAPFVLVLLSCGHETPTPAAHPDATTSLDAARDATLDANTAPPLPENMLLSMHGATLRRAVPLLFPQAGAAEVLAQVAPGITAGIGTMGDEIDIDSPFAAAGIITGTEQATLSFAVAWPLKPGMQVAQDARALRGYRQVSDGLFAPTSPDAGANADNQCWVARRLPAGWMLLCGPRTDLPNLAEFLRGAANAPSDAGTVLELDVRSAILRRLFTRQLAELDAQAPPRADGGVEGARRAMFDDARHSAAMLTALASDVDSVHGVVTQDENSMHVRITADVPHPSSDLIRGLIASASGHQVSASLLATLPATVTAWIAGGFDRARIAEAFGPRTLDPQIVAQAGPELARVLQMVDDVKTLLPLGERVDAFSNDEAHTTYHVIHRADAAQFVDDLRVAMNSIPSHALPDGGNLRDLAVALPTPGITNPNVVRIGRNVHIPPGMQVPPEVRAMIDRSMLLVADGDRVVAVASRDPIARYQALAQGARLAPTLAPNEVYSGHIVPSSLAPLFVGGSVPGLPPSQGTEGADFHVFVEARGDGARLEMRADAPIAAATELRTYWAMIQAVQAQMLQQAMQQQQHAMEAAQRQQRQQMGAATMGPGALPPPPHFQLRPPGSP